MAGLSVLCSHTTMSATIYVRSGAICYALSPAHSHYYSYNSNTCNCIAVFNTCTCTDAGSLQSTVTSSYETNNTLAIANF